MVSVPSPLPVLPGVYYSRCEGVDSRGTISNIFTFQKAGVVLNDPSDTTNAVAVATGLINYWPGMAEAILSDTYHCSRTLVYPLGSPLIPAVEGAITGGGAQGGPVASLSTSAIVSHNVVRRGRGSQSRSNFSPLATTAVDATGLLLASPTPAVLTASFTAFMNLMMNHLTTESPGTWSYVQLSKHPTPRTFVISGSTAEPELSTQRRRVRRGA